ncbi:hypothetical protein OIE62_00670 [Streptomyces scopuliridis]|uniref:Uncharacterized protein n=1 Tax=Streptomyces scopuliridis TaxID=452529 RepID=A0ACD4ZXZ1_9ACTN|nr:hypothetical protein [Streptomyces scopuliridis]WSB38331.1 hypothetical protein OG949_39635 [Streptomyces scopuliridis]WSC02769.1 hypothetical protein OG835_41160 [Streptomyces scopuliridis]WSC03697.1 hypothetical protein OIE62_00670 [Streptomyces scopuliridis]
MTGIDIRHYDHRQAAGLRPLLLEVYEEVYADSTDVFDDSTGSPKGSTGGAAGRAGAA